MTSPSPQTHQAQRRRCLRKRTRIVCISDTHNQTPHLPAGDILIHAGDLTNQGSYHELKKTLEWLEKSEFQAKIVVAGNHEITLDTPFYRENKDHWKWPEEQDPEVNRRLLTESPSITYLENQNAVIYLTAPQGPRTCLKVFGSPCQPNQRIWAFALRNEAEARRTWDRIEEDVDIIVTHTPAHGCVDKAASELRAGCPVLLERLSQVRPVLHVSGHIHGGRGVERVRWRRAPSTAQSSSLGEASAVEAVEYWKDPGAGNKKLSLVDLTRKSGREMGNFASGTRHVVPDSLKGLFGGQPDGLGEERGCQLEAGKSKSTSSLEDGALLDSEAGKWRRTRGGAIELRLDTDVGDGEVDQAVEGCGHGAVDEQRDESVMINAAFLGQRVDGKAKSFNKPIVVDVELPVWEFETESNAG